jgi:hypothetical protein
VHNVAVSHPECAEDSARYSRIVGIPIDVGN